MATAVRCITSISRISRRHSILRSFSTASLLLSGHNRWSKIKHDKIKEDGVRSNERSQWSQNIRDAVKSNLYPRNQNRISLLTHALGNGGDPNSNAELSTLVAQAKKAGLPKDIIERAIAKGKGVSLSGDALEAVTVEAMLPPSVAFIIECQTDNKNRTLNDLRLLMKNIGGTLTSTSHLFERLGRIIFECGETLQEEKVMDHVLEAGALDMEIEDDRKSLLVYTEPSQTASIAQILAESLGLKLKSYEIVWVPRPGYRVEVDESQLGTHLPLQKIIGQIEEDSNVQAVYHNAA
ncbi:MAG: hypothetical protein Q9170_005692 [Blastenia crenularia]